MQEFVFEVTQWPEFGHVPTKYNTLDIIIEGQARVSGLNVPISRHIGLMGMLWSPVRDIVGASHGIDVSMQCMRRESAVSPYELHFNFEKVIEDEVSPEMVKDKKGKYTQVFFKNAMGIYANVIKMFVEDPLGLDEYIRYISTTSDPVEIQIEFVKVLRDEVMVRSRFMTRQQAKARARLRKAKKEALLDAENNYAKFFAAKRQEIKDLGIKVNW